MIGLWRLAKGSVCAIHHHADNFGSLTADTTWAAAAFHEKHTCITENSPVFKKILSATQYTLAQTPTTRMLPRTVGTASGMPLSQREAGDGFQKRFPRRFLAVAKAVRGQDLAGTKRFMGQGGGGGGEKKQMGRSELQLSKRVTSPDGSNLT